MILTLKILCIALYTFDSDL